MASEPLTSAALKVRYQEAIQAQLDAQETLDKVYLAATLAGTEGSPEEKAATLAAKKATEQVERLKGALEQITLAEEAELRRLARADRDAQDAKTLSVVAALEAAAQSFDKHATAYVDSWARLASAAQAAQHEIVARQSHGVVRRDLSVPPLEPRVSAYLAKWQAKPPPPGAASASFGERGDFDPSNARSLSEVLGSLAVAVRSDIDKAR